MGEGWLAGRGDAAAMRERVRWERRKGEEARRDDVERERVVEGKDRFEG